MLILFFCRKLWYTDEKTDGRRRHGHGNTVVRFRGFHLHLSGLHAPRRGLYAPSSGPVTGVSDVEDTWWMKVIRARGGVLLANNSWSGSTVAESGNLGAASLSRIRKLGPDGVSPDVVLVFTGLNDVSRYVALETFRSDYETMIRRIMTLYPAARVLCGTLAVGYIQRPLFPTLTYFGQRLEEYNEAIRQAVAAAGGFLADVASLGESYESMDGLHPSGVGMEQVAAMWLRCLEDGAP